MQFNRIGIENTVDINNPLLSKYCSRENDFQCIAASSFIVSEKYTNNTVEEKFKMKYYHSWINNKA